VWIVLSRIETPELMRKVFLVVASLPVMTQVAIVTKAFGADHRQASLMATLTTACSLVIIPLYMLLLH
jgi:predicted permease